LAELEAEGEAVAAEEASVQFFGRGGPIHSEVFPTTNRSRWSGLFESTTNPSQNDDAIR